MSRVREHGGCGLGGVHTGLGKEGAEAVVGLSGLALLGEAAIGLKERSVTSTGGRQVEKTRTGNEDIPGCRARGSRATTCQSASPPSSSTLANSEERQGRSLASAGLDAARATRRGTSKHTSQHELAIWQPAWPTVHNQCQHDAETAKGRNFGVPSCRLALRHQTSPDAMRLCGR